MSLLLIWQRVTPSKGKSVASDAKTTSSVVSDTKTASGTPKDS